jgi:hypothetical protein
MGTAYGQGSQGAQITIGPVGPLNCTRIRMRKSFENADTTVGDDGWGKICPVYRHWAIEVEMPSRSGDSSDTIADAFDDDAFPDSPEDVDLQDITFQLPNGRTYSGSGMLDGEVIVDASAKDAVRLTFTVRGSDDLSISDE